MFRSLVALESGQFAVRLLRQLGLDVLDEGVELLHSVLLCFLHFLDRASHFTDVVFQIAEPATEATRFTPDQFHVLLVHFFELLKRMLLVLIAEQSAVRANWNLASLAVVAQCSVVLGAKLLSPLLSLDLLLLHHLHHVGEEAAGDELVRAEAGSAVRALRPRLLDPLLQTVVASELGAVWAHDSLLDGAEADEAAEELVKFYLVVRGASPATVRSNPRIDRLDAGPAVVGPRGGQRWDVEVVVLLVKPSADYRLVKGELTGPNIELASLGSSRLLVLFDLLQDIFNLLLF